MVLSNNEMINLEMYNNFSEVECKKSLSYVSMLYSHQLRKRKPYSKIKKVTSINIMAGKYDAFNCDLLEKYELLNVVNHKKLLHDGLEMLLIPLDKLDKIDYFKDESR